MDEQLKVYVDIDNKALMITGGRNILPNPPEVIGFYGYNYIKGNPIIIEREGTVILPIINKTYTQTRIKLNKSKKINKD